MKNLLIALTLIITSLFFFPFEFTFLPSINTKMMLAVLGILFFVWYSLIHKKGIVVTREFFTATIIAGIFSLVGYYATVYNNTTDYTYVSYILSMWVWLFGAYAMICIIARLHGHISLKLLVNYLIGVCVAQCILALMIDNIPSVKYFVDSIVRTDRETMEKIKRLYGIGAALDVAGTRFSAVLLMIAVLISHDNEIRLNRKKIAMYVSGFVLIAVIGSMIARTTNVGIIIALLYVIYASGLFKIRIKKSDIKLWRMMIGVAVFLILICIYLYNNVPAAQKLLSFAFEGLINWLETGEWRTASTDVLQNMWRLPESLKTWIIGDGYFVDPTKGGFYMRTDVGYLRFIYYCGLIGLSVFIIFFIYLSLACYKRFPRERNLFILLLILELMIWAKVATDIFLVYALFMSIPMVQQQMNNQRMNRL